MGTNASGRRTTEDPESVDDSACTILHVDMDAFFALVELRRHPELRDRPMMVAGTGPRSVVLSATYAARATGVRSGMPTGRARALCPGIVVVPPEHGLYSEVSDQVMAMFRDVTPLVEPLSVDEAFLDVSGAGRGQGRPVQIAIRLRQRIADELGLVATVGAAATKFVAKLSSGLAKPDGLLVVPPGEVDALLRPLPVRALWGVGPAQEKALLALGLTTVGDIAVAPRSWLVKQIGHAAGTRLHELANGIDERTVQTDVAEASIGAETTFAVDTADRRILDRELLALADRTARRARAGGVRGRTVALKVRYDDFSTVFRSVTLAEPLDLSRDIHAAAVELLAKLGATRPVRLLGVRLEGLVLPGEASAQLAFDVDPEATATDADWRVAETTVDEVAARFGASAIRPASLLGVSAPRHDRTRQPRVVPGESPDVHIRRNGLSE